MLGFPPLYPPLPTGSPSPAICSGKGRRGAAAPPACPTQQVVMMPQRETASISCFSQNWVPQAGNSCCPSDTLKWQVVGATGKHEEPNPPSCRLPGPRNNTVNHLPRHSNHISIQQGFLLGGNEPICVPHRKRKAIADLSTTLES